MFVLNNKAEDYNPHFYSRKHFKNFILDISKFILAKKKT
jgi:hypothetical protein